MPTSNPFPQPSFFPTHAIVCVTFPICQRGMCQWAVYRGLGPNVTGNESSLGPNFSCASAPFFLFTWLDPNVIIFSYCKISSSGSSSTPVDFPISTIFRRSKYYHDINITHQSRILLVGAPTTIFTNPICGVRPLLRYLLSSENTGGFCSIFHDEGWCGLYHGAFLALFNDSNGALQFMGYEKNERLGIHPSVSDGASRSSDVRG